MSDEIIEISEGRDDRVFAEGENPPPPQPPRPGGPGDEPIETIEIEDDPRDKLEKGEPEPAWEA